MAPADSKMEVERKWEELDSDCLVNIFGRLEVESLLLDIPFVCKTWHQALQNPLCWRNLVFADNDLFSRLPYGRRNPRRSGLVRYVVSRSQRCATKLRLPEDCTEEELIYISDECPALELLALSSNDLDHVISDCIVKWKNLQFLKWKNLQFLRIGSSSMTEIIAQVAVHCKNFVGLSLGYHKLIDRELASEIVARLPNIKYLNLYVANISKDVLTIILKGCKQLEVLFARYCKGFDEHDEDILKLASTIKDFRCQGSSRYYDVEYHNGCYYW